jgi:putative membrane protein
MLSERRLHPFSILFAFLAQVKAFVVPGLLVLVGASSRGADWWQPWMMLLIIPTALGAAVRYLSYRYRYEENEIVIRSGILFRKERHIPYARIQNIDAVQRVLHRLLNVVEVRVETGGGATPEATMSVLPMAAFHEMRERVFAERTKPARTGRTLVGTEGETLVGTEGGTLVGTEGGTLVPPSPSDTAQLEPATELLRLGTRELLLSGFLENRGTVVIAAGFGVVFELGLFDRFMDRSFGSEESRRNVVRQLVRDTARNLTALLSRLAIATAGLIGVLIFIRLLSMIWAAVRLYGFRLTLANGDLRSEYGLFTRVAATIPLRRIQTLSVRQGPLHRLFQRVAIRADTAGGRPNEGGRSEREWLAPILRDEAVSNFVQQVLLVAVDLRDIAWQPVAAGAFRREVKRWLAFAVIAWGGFFWFFNWYSLIAAPVLLTWAVVAAWQTIKHLGWAVTDEAIVFRAGWLSRRVNIVRFAKIQTVTLTASPFDRQTSMAGLRVDTAGGTEASRISIPYLPSEIATALHARLAGEAGRRQFRW